jgi:hypothetical protein
MSYAPGIATAPEHYNTILLRHVYAKKEQARVKLGRTSNRPRELPLPRPSAAVFSGLGHYARATGTQPVGSRLITPLKYAHRVPAADYVVKSNNHDA